MARLNKFFVMRIIAKSGTDEGEIGVLYRVAIERNEEVNTVFIFLEPYVGLT